MHVAKSHIANNVRTVSADSNSHRSKSYNVVVVLMRVRAKLLLNGSVYEDGVYTEGVRRPVPPLQQNGPKCVGSVSGTWMTSASQITLH
jgi:hypothetical protein